MKSLVVLEPASAIGRSYLLAKNADFMHLGTHPVIECSRVEADGPYLHCYVDAHDPAAHPGPRYSEVLVPHHAVAFVRNYTDADGRPFGFVPPKQADDQ
ncbi:hypothetical protein [Stenotrophomonas forensis]